MKFFTQLKDSFFNFPAYRKMIKQSYGKSFLYGVLLSLILSVFVTINIGIKLNDGIKELTKIYESDVPYFEMNDGELDVDIEMPYITDDEGSALYIDTREDADKTVMDDYEQGFFIFRDGIVQKQAFQVQTYEFSEFTEIGNFNKNDVDKIYPMLKGFKAIAYVAIYIGYFIFSILSFLLLSILYGLIGLIIKAIMKSDLTFTELANASIYALTVPKVIKVFLSLVRVNVPHYWIFTFIIMTVYLFMVTKQKDEKEEILPIQ
ncbi:DUF1189 domain-containing protein [Clostridium sp. DL1XJH146]